MISFKQFLNETDKVGDIKEFNTIPGLKYKIIKIDGKERNKKTIQLWTYDSNDISKNNIIMKLSELYSRAYEDRQKSIDKLKKIISGELKGNPFEIEKTDFYETTGWKSSKKTKIQIYVDKITGIKRSDKKFFITKIKNENGEEIKFDKVIDGNAMYDFRSKGFGFKYQFKEKIQSKEDKEY